MCPGHHPTYFVTCDITSLPSVLHTDINTALETSGRAPEAVCTIAQAVHS